MVTRENQMQARPWRCTRSWLSPSRQSTQPMAAAPRTLGIANTRNPGVQIAQQKHGKIHSDAPCPGHAQIDCPAEDLSPAGDGESLRIGHGGSLRDWGGGQ